MNLTGDPWLPSLPTLAETEIAARNQELSVVPSSLDSNPHPFIQ
jgi:hypothetical protein